MLNGQIFHRKIKAQFKNIRQNFFPDKNCKEFIQHCHKNWDEWKVKEPSSVLLIDIFPDSQYILLASYFANILSRKHNSKIVGFATSRLWGSRAFRYIYASFNMAQIVWPRLSDRIKKSYYSDVTKAWEQINTKQDLLDFTYEGIWVGIDIYESYLRAGRPTVNLKDPEVFKLFTRAIELVRFWKTYFDRNEVSSVIVCHDCYLEHHALVKVAYANNVPVYVPNLTYPVYTDKPFTYYSFVKKYHDYFSLLNKKEQDEGLQIGKELLEERLGINSTAKNSTERTTFNGEIKKHRILTESNKLKVLICTHCFFDQPHSYYRLPFVDFYEWLEYLGRVSRETDYDWYIKVHLDPMPGTMDVINAFLLSYPHIKLIQDDSNPYQLAREGLNFILTIHGTVGHEYPALGVQVLNAGFNPHIAYDFNWHARSLQEYEHYLRNLHTLSKQIRIEEMYEFYFVHYRLCRIDDIIFPSYFDYCQTVPWYELGSSNSFHAFITQFSQERHKNIIARIGEFIDSKRHHMFELNFKNNHVSVHAEDG